MLTFAGLRTDKFRTRSFGALDWYGQHGQRPISGISGSKPVRRLHLSASKGATSNIYEEVVAESLALLPEETSISVC